MKKILILGLFLLLCPQLAEAQSQRNPCYYPSATSTSCIPVSSTNPLPVNASVSASVGGFHWEASLTPVSASTTPVTTTITAGKTIVIQNIGTTNSAYCALGGTTSSNATAVPPNSSVSLTSTGETSLTCVTSASTTTLNLQSGTGLWTNFGGGSSGGGGGASSAFDAAFPANGTAIGISDGTNMKNWLAAIALGDGVNGNNTGAVAPWLWNGTTYDRASGTAALGQYVQAKSGAYSSGSIASGAMVDLGSQSDAACGTDTGTCSAIALIKRGNQNATNINTNVQASIPAGSNSIGVVGADPSKGRATPSSVAINVSTATTTQLIALSGTTKIYITSYDVIAGGTGNITFVYGTGASCGTGTTSLTGAYPLTAQAGIAKGNGVGAILIVPAGNALCVATSAAVQMSGSVSYQQF